MKIYYGVSDKSIDVTEICIQKLTKDNIITIPSGDDNRTIYFTDPLCDIHKKIIIDNNDTITEYDEFTEIIINVLNNTINTKVTEDNVNKRLTYIHSKLKINYGNFDEEFAEQKMSVIYLTGNEKVLELGGNIGRNSLVIATILKNSSNLLTLECDDYAVPHLTENRDLNNLNFHIESSALSASKLIQKGWQTKPSDTLEEGHKWVNTITWDNLKSKYKIDFDTLVLDCEGAFYYILKDTPEILNNINLIIMENDYFYYLGDELKYDVSKKNYVDEILIKNNFILEYTQPLLETTLSNFYEVWIKQK